MNIEEYKQKLKVERERYEEIKALDFPRPILNMGFFKWIIICPVCGVKLETQIINNHGCVICSCGYGYIWKKSE